MLIIFRKIHYKIMKIRAQPETDAPQPSHGVIPLRQAEHSGPNAAFFCYDNHYAGNVCIRTGRPSARGQDPERAGRQRETRSTGE